MSVQSLEEQLPMPTSVLDQCPFRIAPNCSQAAMSRYRNIDGSCNNLNNGFWGAAFTPFERMLPAMYDYCKEYCPFIVKVLTVGKETSSSEYTRLQSESKISVTILLLIANI
ncbi:hypothetical protein CHS0354_038591 [Potamilus streckersoni]|uniref:Uncharacterized protein n=1 Tax=Potamilus streckersoni TaxID=2493646 RepID=A0AAE0TH54_9BIVA|nr:hypothetical protein CHS0354_038591 [Potamilus streckersoni]